MAGDGKLKGLKSKEGTSSKYSWMSKRRPTSTIISIDI